ncbi:indolepyruvate ferredoxin oxidoreductase beta subunit [Thermanaeromonas toyohensis ToBE]|uniref:Indolepyruvate ferredoxin oxidoreductase beta subunit n=1 Tax=Thermanaeromonas toyohensis ToBE TaxID=698762 RepID=A0A1W1VAW6_9FIRM|nr:indolepyruvate oxidoreductase subunit beta [Thermanaeromonas toyohensis]SMB90498.1 indolepyruvate ferredoxin oxidoreductase beta subunit [Thermanaeromonas toyohensis ToBE]
MHEQVTSIILTGVGGQGTVLAGRILSRAAASLGKEVKVADLHGMAQRGGSVITHVRFGPKVYSPVIASGTADYLVAFEKLEACRCLPFLKPEGVLIVNNQEIPPLPVLIGAASYPRQLLEILDMYVEKLVIVDALKKAKEAGTVKAVNMVLLGVLARHLSIPKECWEEAILTSVKPEFQEVNLRAFSLGWETES